MAIDFQQISEQIKAIGDSAQERKEMLEKRREIARTLFQAYADNLDRLREKLDAALKQDANIRCAVPLDEHLDTRVGTPDLAMDATLIAADGSQIVPDRHAAVQFGLVNVGAIVMELNSGKTPDIFTDSQLYYGEELFTEHGSTIGDKTIALRRDLAECTALVDLVKKNAYSTPVITFTDGPIALWKSESSEYEKSLEKYLSALSSLQSMDVITAGYIDNPAANPVLRLLEIMMAPADKLGELRAYHPLLGVSDLWLFGEKKNPLLKSGERSAVFELQSKAKMHYKGVLGLHFFYLNVGTEGHPYPVRVEIPKWVADDEEKLDNLHAALIEQSRILGNKPYPYLLHRSHEVAVVSFDEKRQVEQMLVRELNENEIEFGEVSGKKSAKDVSGS